MNFEEIKRQVSIKDYADANLEHKGRTYVCPKCESGNGPKGTPAFNLKGEHFTCFSCGASGDVFDLAGIVNDTDDKREQLKAVAEWAGIRIEDESTTRQTARRSKPATKPSRPRDRQASPDVGLAESETARRAETSAYIAACRERIGDPAAVAYVERRGFTLEEARRFGWGFDPHDAKRGKPGIVLPYGPDAPWYYTLRYTGMTSDEGGKYYKPYGLAEPRNCVGALDRAEAVFVTEGLFDAYAVMACGHDAITLNGVSNATHVAQAIVARAYKGCVIVMLDTDKAGQAAAETMRGVLESGGVYAVLADKFPGHDAAEVLERDRETLTAYLHDQASVAVHGREEWMREKYADALNTMQVKDPVETMQAIWRGEGRKEPIPTGIGGLDKALDGGIRTGLVVFGGVSSIGKTTTVLNMVDNIAASGRGVLFVTIEQSAQEIVAKSLSRCMRQRGYAVPYYEIMGTERLAWPEAEEDAFYSACEDYANATNGRLHILEAETAPTVEDIGAVAKVVAEHDGRAPVIFIDYLQLLAPPSERDTDVRIAVDKNVSELRRMAKRLDTPIVVISSLNRSSCSGLISMDSFKESGGIEYGADVLMGLQPYRMKERIEERKRGQEEKSKAKEIIEETKSKSAYECELVILKNRAGRIPESPIPITMVPISSVIFDGTEKDIPTMPRPA